MEIAFLPNTYVMVLLTVSLSMMMKLRVQVRLKLIIWVNNTTMNRNAFDHSIGQRTSSFTYGPKFTEVKSLGNMQTCEKYEYTSQITQYCNANFVLFDNAY